MSYTRSVDGLSVDDDRCRVSGQIHVDQEDAKSFHVGSDVVVVMLARVAGPTFKESKGEITRVNVLKPLEMRTVTEGEFRVSLMEELGFDYVAVGEDPLKEPDIEFGPDADIAEGRVSPVREDLEEFFQGLEPVPDGPVAAEEEEEVSEDELLKRFEPPKDTRTPVGGGLFAEGEEAERLRRFLDE